MAEAPLAALVTVYTQFTSWFGDMAANFLKSPLFLIPLAIFCFGAVIGLVHRVVR